MTGRTAEVQRHLAHGAVLPAARATRSDRRAYAFGVFVLLYFAAQLLRGWLA